MIESGPATNDPIADMKPYCSLLGIQILAACKSMLQRALGGRLANLRRCSKADIVKILAMCRNKLDRQFERAAKSGRRFQ